MSHDWVLVSLVNSYLTLLVTKSSIKVKSYRKMKTTIENLAICKTLLALAVKKQKCEIHLLSKGYIHLLFYLLFCPIRSGAPIKSGLVHISPVHVLDKAILSHLWTKIHINCTITLDNQLTVFRKIGSGSVHVLIQVHKKWTRANRVSKILFVLGCYESLECLERWIMNGLFSYHLHPMYSVMTLTLSQERVNFICIFLMELTILTWGKLNLYSTWTGHFVYLQAEPVDKSLLACCQVQWVPGQVALTQKRTRWFICTFI